MNFIVHCKLCCSQPLQPVLLFIIYKEPQVLFQLLVYVLYVLIYLRVEYCWQLFWFPAFYLNSLINSATNWGFLSDITLSDNPCNFYILSLNNLANLSAYIFSVVATKYTILDNLLHTTKITSFSTTNGNFVIKLTIRCI